MEEFEALRASFLDQYSPQTLLEMSLVQSITEHEWYMRRAVRVRELLERTDGYDESSSEVMELVEFYRRHLSRSLKAKRRLQSIQEQRLSPEKESPAASESTLTKMRPISKWLN